jgi:two-component system, NtrC family, response regulator GlrR
MATATILVTDDELGYRQMLEKALTQKGFAVLTASSGLEALGLLLKNKVDLVVTDMKMPKSDGVTLVVAIRKHHGGIPVILMTAYAIEEQFQKALDNNVAAILKKPFNIEDLVKAIHAALKK